MATDEIPLPVLARKVTIPNPLGLHMRPVAQFADIVHRFQSKVTVRKGKQSADARDLFGMMLLEAPRGSELEIEADGEDAAEVLEALTDLVAEGFGEMNLPGDEKNHG